MQNKKSIPNIIGIIAVLLLSLSGCSSEKGKGLTIGEQFPVLHLQDMEGAQVNLSEQFTAKRRLVSIRTIGCRYCESDFVELEKIYQEFSRDELDVAVIAVACESPVLAAFLKGKQVSFPVFVDEKMEAMRKTNSVILPVAYMVDSEGKIIYKAQGALGRREIQAVFSTTSSM